MASVGISQTALAGLLYDSLHQHLLTLPDETLVYPAHGAGSMWKKLEHGYGVHSGPSGAV